MASHPVAAVLLSAGESTRMGEPKALLPWQGTTLLQYQVSSLLDAGVAQVIVVLGHEAERLRERLPVDPRVKVAINPRYRKGKTTSVKAGLSLIDEQTHVMILAVDQPRPHALVRAVLEEHLARNALITAPSYKGRLGHPILFSALLRAEMQGISEEGEGLREVVERHIRQVHRVPVDSPLACLDINTLEDYRQAKALWETERARSNPGP